MRDIIVIGAPIGGADALLRLIRSLPGDLDASILAVLHERTNSPILLADVLNAPGRLRATEAIQDEPIERRRVYVAADGKHLMMRGNRTHLSSNGVEHPFRPSIDVLFTSAAEAYDVRVVGVLLLHANEDGAVGLGAIQKAGGRTVTHRNEKMLDSPRDPESGKALGHDHLSLEEIGPCVVAYVKETNADSKSSG